MVSANAHHGPPLSCVPRRDGRDQSRSTVFLLREPSALTRSLSPMYEGTRLTWQFLRSGCTVTTQKMSLILLVSLFQSLQHWPQRESVAWELILMLMAENCCTILTCLTLQ